jgi:hypothetical protein
MTKTNVLATQVPDVVGVSVAEAADGSGFIENE